MELRLLAKANEEIDISTSVQFSASFFILFFCFIGRNPDLLPNPNSKVKVTVNFLIVETKDERWLVS